MPLMSLYNACLLKVSRFLNTVIWEGGRQSNPFKHLPSNIIRDLMKSTLLLQNSKSFRHYDWESLYIIPELKIQGLELLLTSETLPELNIQGMNVQRNLGRALNYLASACQNLEVLTLRHLHNSTARGISTALEEVLRNSHNLKLINCEIKFDLKALRNCKKLRSVKLFFQPKQPWYDFLEKKDDSFQNLHSLELFTVYNVSSCGLIDAKSTDYIVTILGHCNALTSLGFLDTTRAIPQSNRPDILPYAKLRHCQWYDHEKRLEETLDGYVDENIVLCPEVIRDAVKYHSFVEELYVTIHVIESIGYLSNLRNLVFLDLSIEIKSDFRLDNVFKDIGAKLKHLCLRFKRPTDISLLLQTCSNLEAFKILASECTERFEADINLPKLKYLSLVILKKACHVLSHFSKCHNVTELFMKSVNGFDDETSNKFLRMKFLSKLKIAYFKPCELSADGVKEFLKNTPELQKLVIEDNKKEFIETILLEENHNATCKRFRIGEKDEFFNKKKEIYNF